MNEDQLFTRPREGSKQQIYLWMAKFLAYAFLGFVIVAMLQFAMKIWLIFFVDLGAAILTGCVAIALYALSRKASGE